MFNAFLVEIDQLPNLSHLSFFYKMDPVFFKESTKILSVFYQYGYADITKKRDPCRRVNEKKVNGKGGEVIPPPSWTPPMSPITSYAFFNFKVWELYIRGNLPTPIET